MKIGCQTITFGNERHKSDMENIVKAVALAGYGGMETGFFRLDLGEAQNYKRYQREYNIRQAAIHIGGNYHDAESVKNQLANISGLIKLAHTLGCDNIFLSANAAHSEAEYKIAAGNIDSLGKMLHENGLVLSYHNHAGEIHDNCLGLFTYADNTDPKYVSFVPDVGWVTQGGGDPVEVLKRLGERMSHLHFKEFTKEGKITELGCGVVNFRGVYETVKHKDIWIIAEQDETLIGAEESIAANFGYLKNLIG